MLLAAINLFVFIIILWLNTFLSSLWLGVVFGCIFGALVILLFYVNRGYYARKNKQKIRHIIINAIKK